MKCWHTHSAFVNLFKREKVEATMYRGNQAIITSFGGMIARNPDRRFRPPLYLLQDIIMGEDSSFELLWLPQRLQKNFRSGEY